MRNNTIGEKDEAVARNALLVAHRTQAMHATGGQIGDEPRIAGGRPAEMVPDAIEERGQIVFTHAEFVELIGRGGLIGVGQRFYLFKNRLMHRWRRRCGAGSCARVMVAPCGMAVERNCGVDAC